MPVSDPTTSGVYAIRCTANGKLYIGSAVNLAERWADHRRTLMRGCHRNGRLQRAWSKYGRDAFVFEVLESVATREELVAVEQRWIDRHRSYAKAIGFNISPTAGSNLGVRHREETKAKIAAAHRGKTHSAETRARMSAERKGVPLSEQRRAKLKGRVLSPETREKMSASRRGRKVNRSPEAKAKLLAIHKGNAYAKGRKHTPEERAKISAALKGRDKGKILGAEHRAKMSAAQRRRYHGPSPGQQTLPFLD